MWCTCVHVFVKKRIIVIQRYGATKRDDRTNECKFTFIIWMFSFYGNIHASARMTKRQNIAYRMEFYDVIIYLPSMRCPNSKFSDKNSNNTMTWNVRWAFRLMQISIIIIAAYIILLPLTHIWFLVLWYTALWYTVYHTSLVFVFCIFVFITYV